MKPIKPQFGSRSTIASAISGISISPPLQKSSFLTKTGLKLEAFCLQCPGKNCMAIENQAGITQDLCPAGAISFDKGSKNISISSACFGCGLCAMVCPTGAIHINQNGKAEVGSNSLSIETEEADDSHWESWLRSRLEIKYLDSREIVSTAESLANKCMELKGNLFYKIIESILKLLGYDAKMSHLGDTSNRIDLIIRTPQGNVPVEIKSYTETPTINWKSVQQAVENKLLISRLDGNDEMTPLSSLVIGFSYPSERTRIEEHVKDIEEAFGIRVGIVSLGKLWELLLTENYSRIKSAPIDLISHRGIL